MRKLKLDELGRPSLEEYINSEKIPLVVVLDDIRSAMNVGSIFRSADAFGIEKIYLCGITAKPPHREITKTAIGATESVKWSYAERIEEVLSALIEEDYTIVGIEQTDESVDLKDFSIDPNMKYALVFGNEVNGINDGILSTLHSCIELKQHGTKHSLNVAVCTGIVLWHFQNALRT